MSKREKARRVYSVLVRVLPPCEVEFDEDDLFYFVKRDPAGLADYLRRLDDPGAASVAAVL